jgi:hypothetical protein
MKRSCDGEVDVSSALDFHRMYEVNHLIFVIGKYLVGKILFSNNKMHGVKTHIQELLHMQEFEFESYTVTRINSSIFFWS